MSQQNKDRSSPAAKPKAGCGSAIVKGLLVLVVLIVAAGVAYYLRIESLRSAAREETFRKDLEQPKRLALSAVAEHDEVKAALGDPVEDKQNLRREGTGELDTCNAVFSFDVGGAKRTATVDCRARRESGNWQVLEIKVKLAGGQTITVPPPKKEAAQELEFKL